MRESWLPKRSSAASTKANVDQSNKTCHAVLWLTPFNETKSAAATTAKEGDEDHEIVGEGKVTPL